MPVALAHLDVGDGPPVVLMHGLFGSSTNWRGIAKALGATHRVLSLDLRNHGASPWAESMTYDEMADDVATFIDRMRLGAPVVIGHSMGGKVAMTLALTRPTCVGRLVVVDVAPVAYGDHFSSYVTAMRGIAAMQATGRDEVRRAMLDAIPDERVVGFLMTNLVRHDERFDWRINLAAIGAALPTIGGWPAALDERHYDGPVTVIDGERSDYVGDEDRARFERLFPRVAFETIAGAGHWLHADRPDAFIAAVERALVDRTAS